MNETQEWKRAPRYIRITLWILAVVLMLTSAVYQRLTGPTYRLRGEYELAGQVHKYRLIRSAYSTHDTLTSVPDPGSGVTGTLFYKRYPTNDEFTTIPLELENGRLGARLPVQPPAGKLEYYFVLNAVTGDVRIPGSTGENVIIRFKGYTPLYVLLPHVFMMFFAVLFGMRAALAAAFDPGGMRSLAWTTLVLMTVGGMVLGPIVQNTAFGAYWTGFPLGYDLTDNKTLLMWIVWVFACWFIGTRPRQREGLSRLSVILATVVMMVVYLIPHSLRGSELDYSELDQGVPAEEAIGVG